MKQAKDKKSDSGIANVKNWVETIQGIATIVAICAGAYWFFMQRSTNPQVKLDQTVTQRLAVAQSNQTLITVDVRATNIGKVKVDLGPGQLELFQINPSPAPPTALISYTLKALTLVPGESDQAIFAAIKVQNTVKTVQVHSYYPVPHESKKYWNLLSAVDIGTDASKKESASSVH